MRKGKLIVIDGTDGSGKATQAALLFKNLQRTGRKVKLVDFPRYGKKSAGLVEEYLNGVYGPAMKLGPYIPSIFYAVDRFAASEEIQRWLKEGRVVIANRYVTANLGHQGGKIKKKARRKKFYQWAAELEYGLFGIPRPDLNLIFHVPALLAQKLVDRKGSRSYLKGKKRDLHEADLKHLRAAEQTYLEIAKLFHYPVIKCFQRGRLLSPTQIAKSVWQKVTKIL